MEKGKIRFIILLSLFAVLTAILTLVFWPFIRDLRDPAYRESFSLWVKGLGYWGAPILLGVQILQSVIAIIPGGPVALIAGAAYGYFGGFIIIAVGCVLSSTLIFLLARKFGLPLLRRFFGEKDINSWKVLKDPRNLTRLVFILFLIPGTPKDLLTWLCPLTDLSLSRFVILSTLARIPSILSGTIMGDSVIRGNWILFVSIFTATALIGFFGLWFGDRIAGRAAENNAPQNRKSKTGRRLQEKK